MKKQLRCQSIFIYLYSENECIMELFKGQSLLEFTERFKTDLDCEEYLDKHISKTAYIRLMNGKDINL